MDVMYSMKYLLLNAILIPMGAGRASRLSLRQTIRASIRGVSKMTRVGGAQSQHWEQHLKISLILAGDLCWSCGT